MAGTRSPRQRHRCSILEAVALVSLAASLLLAAAPSTAYHLGLDVVHEEQVNRSGAFGARVELAEPGTLEFVVNGYGEVRSTPVSHGVAVFEDGDYVGMIVVTAHHSPDRLRLATSPTGEIVSNPEADGETEVHVDGSLGEVGELEVTVEVAHGVGGEEPVVRTFAALHGRQAGTHEAIVWLGETERSELEVHTDARVDKLATRTGTSHVAGDQDLDEATVDAQAQEGFVAGSVPLSGTRSLGAKALYQASTDVDVRHELHGVWASYEDKDACISRPACADASDLRDGCRLLVGVNCGPTSLSWHNETEAERGWNPYVFNGADRGSYSFSVDRKLDAYEAAGPGFDWEENHSYLSVADVGLPG